MDESLVFKQDQVAILLIVSNMYRKNNSTSASQIYTIYNSYGPIGGHFGGLVDIATKRTL
jgi:hypothetical protein